MASGQGSSSSSSTQPWKAQAPYLKEIYQQAQGLFNQPQYQYGPGRVAGMDPSLTSALNQVDSIYGRGLPGVQQAQALNQQTMRGDFLSPETNPYIQGTYDAAARNVTRSFQEAVMPSLNTRFAQGRTQQDVAGNAQTAAMGRAQSELGATLGDLASNIYGQNYAAERNRQMTGMQYAPTLAQSQYIGTNEVQSAAQVRQDFAQRALDDLIARFQFNQYAPAEKLAEYSGFIGAPVSTSRSSSVSAGIGIL